MAKKNKNTEAAGNDLLENPEALAQQFSRTEEFVEKNKNVVLVVGGLFLVAILGYMFYNYYVGEQDKNAQRDLYQAVYYFEADSLGRALNGDGNNFGFLEIIEEYGMTNTANLAHYYAGATYLKLGDFDNAVSYLEKFSVSDYLVQARAYSLIGDAYMGLQEYEKAVSFYEKAANYNANKQFTPTYLVKAAIANEKLNNLESAIANYQTILDDYYGATEYSDAKKHKARLQGALN
ncbi:tetratricopeptide repeat protein [Reichenbachiella sp. MALMAid0571]|uniref:tetratricopeptide repeat protein n=1 Tax=Reichenbachiella sp. MALMAid0571 TaxID=3143939 RepID=UPI0032DE90FE